MRLAIAMASLLLALGPARAENFYVEYAVLVDLAHNFCRGYYYSDADVAKTVGDRNTALGVKFLGEEAFDTEYPLVRKARLYDARHMDTKRWCEKTRSEITAHGDGAMFPPPPPKPPKPVKGEPAT